MLLIKQKRPGNFGKLRQEKVSKDKSVCFRKRPSFINETIHYEELSETCREFNPKKRKREEFEKKAHNYNRFVEVNSSGNEEESTASAVGKASRAIVKERGIAAAELY